VFWRLFFPGLLVIAGVAGLISYSVPASAAVPLRIIAAVLGLAVGLYNFWTKMMEKA
jgi:hypothetical protein